MADFTVGDDIVWYWPLFDDFGAPLTGKAAFITASVIKPDGTAATPTKAESVIAGTYSFTVADAVAGRYQVVATYSEAGDVQNFSLKADVADSVATEVRDIAITGAPVGSLGYEVHSLFIKPIIFDGDV